MREVYALTPELVKIAQEFNPNEDLAGILASLRERDARLIAENRAAVISRYGEMSDQDILQVLKVEKEAAECEGCTGLPCRKRRFKETQPRIQMYCGRVYCNTPFCKYRQAKDLQRKYGFSEIPAEYVNKSWSDYKVDGENERAVKLARRLSESKTKGAYFYGGVGVGKTFLVSLIAQEVIKAGRGVLFATVPTISMKLRSTFKDNAKNSEEELLEKLYRVDTLILDDVGMEKPTRFICSTISNIFNERYNGRLQTIMTSNYTLKQLEGIFNNPSDSKDGTLDGSRIADRARQMCIPIEMKGGSRR